MKKHRRNNIIKLLLLFITIVCLFRISESAYSSFMNQRQQESLKKLKELGEQESTEKEDQEEKKETKDTGAAFAISEKESAVSSENLYSVNNHAGLPEPNAKPSETAIGLFPVPVFSKYEKFEKEVEEMEEPVMLNKYAGLYEKNNDIVGWLSIEGTKIDYPVMRSEDDEFYLRRDFFGKSDRHGCLYVRNRADVDTSGTNFIIYGHNMKDGTMFRDLLLYEKESFFKKHPLVLFDTLYEERVYEIVAVFFSQVYYSNEDVFKYYQFYEAKTQEEFDYFYENIKALSLYDTGVTAEFGDTFLTLSTCAYHVQDGRFAVVAKKVADKE